MKICMFFGRFPNPDLVLAAFAHCSAPIDLTRGKICDPRRRIAITGVVESYFSQVQHRWRQLYAIRS